MFLSMRLPRDLSAASLREVDEEEIRGNVGGHAAGRPDRTATGSGSLGYLRRPQDKTFRVNNLTFGSIDLKARFTQEELEEMGRREEEDSD